MPRYFFDTDDGTTMIIDDVGRDLTDDAAARGAGLDTLPDMTREKALQNDHWTYGLTIRDHNREVIYSATLALLGEWKKRKSMDPEDLKVFVNPD